MKYEISTIGQLKAACFDAIEKEVVMSRSCLMSFDAFDRAIGHYLDMSYGAGALDPAVADALEDGTLCEWLKELRVQYLGYAI